MQRPRAKSLPCWGNGGESLPLQMLPVGPFEPTTKVATFKETSLALAYKSGLASYTGLKEARAGRGRICSAQAPFDTSVILTKDRPDGPGWQGLHRGTCWLGSTLLTRLPHRLNQRANGVLEHSTAEAHLSGLPLRIEEACEVKRANRLHASN